MAAIAAASASATSAYDPISPPAILSRQDLMNQEFVETRSVTLEWKVSHLKTLFEQSKGDNKSKCVKSALFDNQRWQIFLYPNSGHEAYISLYLSCEPTAAERERGLAEQARWASGETGAAAGATSGTAHDGDRQPQRYSAVGAGAGGGGGSGAAGKDASGNKGPWRREGKFKFTFEIKTIDRRMTFKSMDAVDHAFSDSQRNWGWSLYSKRADMYYNNPTIRLADAFLIVCTIVYSPTPPSPPPMPRLLIPTDLVQAYASLFDDPEYSDVVFKIRPSRNLRRKGGRAKERRLYAAKKVLAGRCEYFDAMFNSGFNESSQQSQAQHQDSSVRTRRRATGDAATSTTSSSTTASTSNTGRASPFARDHREITTIRAEIEDGDSYWSGDEDASVDDNDEDDSEEDYDAFEEDYSDDCVEGDDEEDEDFEENDDVAQPPSRDEQMTDLPNSARVVAQRSATDDDVDAEAETEGDAEGPTAFVDAPASPTKPRTRTHLAPAATINDQPVRAPFARKTRRKVPRDSRPRFEVIVTDAAYQSYRALLGFLYTDSITFAPLSSSYYVAQDAAASTDSPFPYASRRAYLLANTPFTHLPGTGAGSNSVAGVVAPCSAKAIYRLADKLHLPELKERAFDHIVKNLTIHNVALEVFGSFAQKFEDVQRVEMAFLLERWSDAKASPSFRRIFEYLRKAPAGPGHRGRSFPGFEQVFLLLLENLEYVPRQTIGSGGGAGDQGDEDARG